MRRERADIERRRSVTQLERGRTDRIAMVRKDRQRKIDEIEIQEPKLSVRNPAERKARLRAHIASPSILVLPGVVDALTARLAASVGFDALFVTGAGIANSAYGLPDIGLLTATDMGDAVTRITDAVDLPVIADADTGYGNALNVFRTVQAYERAGVAGIVLEDQVTPKKCGHFSDKMLIDLQEMLEKISAFRQARNDDALVLMARTDAIGVAGFDEAIRRANAFVRAGADIVFVEAPEDDDQLRMIPELVGAPVVANMVEGGRTPLHSAKELQEMGYSAVIFANMTMRVAAFASLQALRHLAATGDSRPLMDQMLPWESRQAFAGLPAWQALEAELENDAWRALSGEETDSG